IRRKEWQRKQGRLLSNQTVGVIGLGRVGAQVARFLFDYGCRVLGYDVTHRQVAGVELASLDDIYSEANVISLHVPYLPSTYKMIDENVFNKLKRDVVLINTSRGEVIDEGALWHFLKSNPDAHCCLDTF